MNRSLSIYLDALRFAAAATVFLSHLSWQKLSGGFLWQIRAYGHDAVIVFFVLSGFVIAHAVAREPDFRSFAAARLARLYSVVAPALVLSLLLDSIGTSIAPEVYIMERENQPLLRLLTAATFTSQSWGLDLSLFSNVPYWSLPFEFWYYAIFGCLFYLRGWPRLVGVLVAALVAGPKILLYAPIWAIGVVAWHLAAKVHIGRATAHIVFFASLLLGIALASRHVAVAHDNWLPTEFSAIDYLLGLVVGLNLLVAGRLDWDWGALAAPIRRAAGFTLSLYLFHVPLLHLVAALTPPGLPALARAAILAAITLPLVVALGLFTEHKKQAWRVWFGRWLRAGTPPGAARPRPAPLS